MARALTAVGVMLLATIVIAQGMRELQQAGRGGGGAYGGGGGAYGNGVGQSTPVTTLGGGGGNGGGSGGNSGSSGSSSNGNSTNSDDNDSGNGGGGGGGGGGEAPSLIRKQLGANNVGLYSGR